MKWRCFLSGTLAFSFMFSLGGFQANALDTVEMVDEQGAMEPAVPSANALSPAVGIDSGEIYYIRSLCSGKYLTSDDDVNAVQTAFTGAANQQWRVTYNTVVTIGGSGYYLIVPQSMTTAHLHASGTANGSNVSVSTSGMPYPPCFFRLLDSGNGTYRIQSKNAPGYVLDVCGPSTASGANIQLWEYENVPQQKWIFERATTGVKNNTYYYLKNTYSDKYLDVSNSADTNGTSVRTYTFNGNSNQKWKAVITGNNTYKFVAGSSSTGKVLNVSGSSVNLWTSANATYQYFRLVRDNSISWGGRYYIQYGSKYLVSDIDGQLYFSENKGTHGLWSLEKVTKGTARIYTQSDDIDSTPMDSSFKSNCSAMGYTAYAQHETSRTAPLSHLTSTDICVGVQRDTT